MRLALFESGCDIPIFVKMATFLHPSLTCTHVTTLAGKFHGACSTGAGADPIDAPEAPWLGACGNPRSSTYGRAENTFTSGFEGQWTEEPTVWDNSYFQDLLKYDWEIEYSPADLPQ